MPSNLEVKSEDFGSGTPVSGAEVTELFKKHLSGRVRPAFLKALLSGCGGSAMLHKHRGQLPWIGDRAG